MLVPASLDVWNPKAGTLDGDCQGRQLTKSEDFTQQRHRSCPELSSSSELRPLSKSAARTSRTKGMEDGINYSIAIGFRAVLRSRSQAGFVYPSLLCPHKIPP
jgi:hypothetical protein